MKLLLIALMLTTVSCSDAARSKAFGFGSKHSVKCYSGTETIYEGVSTGKVLSEKTSDGYYFEDANTGKLVEVSGNCVITKL